MELYNLPDGWKWIPFKECIQDLSRLRKKIKTTEYQIEGKYPIIDQGKSFIAGYTDDNSLLYSGELPVIIFGDHTKNIKYIDFAFVGGADGTKVLKTDRQFYPKFFYFYLRSLNIFNLGYSRHFKLLKDIFIPCPSILIQKRIVTRIEALTSRVERAQQLRQQAINESLSFTPSLLNKLFHLAEIRGWKKSQLGEITTITMGQSPKGHSYNQDGVGSPLLNGPTEFGLHHPMPMQWTTEPVRFCEEGDILFCVRGSTTGRMNWADQKYCIGRGLASIRPDLNKCLPEFIYAFVQTQSAAILHYGEGGVFPNFNKDQLSVMEIPLPTVSEQHEIVKYIKTLQSKAEQLKQLQAETEAELAQFIPALLAKAFRGEL